MKTIEELKKDVYENCDIIDDLYNDLDSTTSMNIFKLIALCDDISEFNRIILLESFIDGSLTVYNVLHGLGLE